MSPAALPARRGWGDKTLACRATVTGWGMYVPPKIVTNDDLAAYLDTSDEWIRTRTGIRERRVAGPGETTSSMGARAARDAMRVARVAPDDVDLVLVATGTADYPTMPSTASLIQEGLGLRRAGALDLGAACTGFVYALATADSFIRSRNAECVLVIGSETYSRILDWEDRSTCILFGDGAGAVVVQPSHGDGGVLALTLGSDGGRAGMLTVPAGGSSRPATRETVDQRLHYVTMDGKGVFRFSVEVVPAMTRAALAKACLAVEDVDLFIAHQANARILQATAKALNAPIERFFMNLDRYGNTSAASIPIAVAEAAESGVLKEGDVVALLGFGGGLTWGAAVLRWGACGVARHTKEN